ncbi:hypothetical protein B0H63DRAFT_452403 [Podospora didyma]|uniref:Secreted protein n=1 Tax=Podospora didyma TaxID=330526 RepID=A0AAE0KE64_9PEZI|nr:hypothetical protein B0H63DRAFT_452403 [Podospora didyma]
MKSTAVLAIASLMAGNAMAATGVLFTGQGCNVGTQLGVCYGISEGACCNSLSYAASARVWNDGSYTSFAWYNINGRCGQEADRGSGSACLETGFRDIFGVYYRTGASRRRDTRVNGTSIVSPAAEACESQQLADVYWLKFPNEKESTPYSASVVDVLHGAAAIDWKTQTFKVESVKTVRDILGAHGDGLTDEMKVQNADLLAKLRSD